LNPYLQAAGIDHVTFGRSTGLEDYPYVDFDVAGMAAESARLFVRDGHRRIALARRAEPLHYERVTQDALVAETARLGLPAEAVRILPMRDGRLGDADIAALARPGNPTAILATHECLAAALYEHMAALGRRIGTDVSVICTFPSIDTRGLNPALSHFQADLDAVGIALAEQLVALLAENPADRRRLASTLVPLRFAPRASHGRAEPSVQRVTQAPLRDEERTQASTKATPVTPSSIVG
jgi:DNA-binding LacI/PurR family transcriptional regulator